MKTAVIVTGGKQYIVEPGKMVKIEKIKGDYKKGDGVLFDRVLLQDDGEETKIGAPFLEGVQVKGTIEEIGRNKKVIVIKYKAKSRYFKKRGHRQPYMKVKIV